ncbi:MAG: HDOD domain-containing protein [Opitutaceae bacterium]
MDPEAPPTLEQICERAKALPCSPAVLPQLLAAIGSEESTAGEIERIVLLDSALAAATLRLANSAYVSAGEPIGSVEQAILMLGHREIYRIASLTAVSRWEERHHRSLPWEPGDYTRHSLCTALAAEAFAERSDRVGSPPGGRLEPSASYTVGLVCDVGKLVLAYFCAPFYPRISALAAQASLAWEDAEKQVLGYHHSEVGARLLSLWRFPEPYAQAVAWQHSPEKAPAGAIGLVAQLHAARYVAVCLGPGVTEEGFLYGLRGALLTEWGYTAEIIEQVMVEVRDRAVKRLGDRLSVGLPKG